MIANTKVVALIPFRPRESAVDFGACENALCATVLQLSRNSTPIDAVVASNETLDVPPGLCNNLVLNAPVPSCRREVLLDRAYKRFSCLLYAFCELQVDIVVILDADDLVSVSYAADIVKATESPGCGGAFVERGYIFDARHRRLQEKHGFNRFCGSSLAYTRRLLDALCIRSTDIEQGWIAYDEFLQIYDSDLMIDLFGDHIRSRQRADIMNYPLVRLGEPAVTWVVNNENNESRTRLPYGSRHVDEQYLTEYGVASHLVRDASFSERVAERYRYLKSFFGSFAANVGK